MKNKVSVTKLEIKPSVITKEQLKCTAKPPLQIQKMLIAFTIGKVYTNCMKYVFT